MNKNQLLVAACGLATLIAILALVFFGKNMGSFIDSKSIRPLAIYKGFVIGGYASRFNEILIGDPMNTANLFVELPSKKRFPLRDLPEEIAGQLFEYHNRRPDGAISYTDHYTRLIYRDSKINFAALTNYCPFLISPNKDGPYVKLPISRETLLKVFGKPLRWEKAPRPPSGP